MSSSVQTDYQHWDDTPGEAANSLDDEQKRRLRAVRRGYRAAEVNVKNNGWEIEIVYLDGSRIVVDSKLLKLKSSEVALSEKSAENR